MEKLQNYKQKTTNNAHVPSNSKIAMCHVPYAMRIVQSKVMMMKIVYIIPNRVMHNTSQER